MVTKTTRLKLKFCGMDLRQTDVQGCKLLKFRAGCMSTLPCLRLCTHQRTHTVGSKSLPHLNWNAGNACIGCVVIGWERRPERGGHDAGVQQPCGSKMRLTCRVLWCSAAPAAAGAPSHPPAVSHPAARLRRGCWRWQQHVDGRHARRQLCRTAGGATGLFRACQYQRARRRPRRSTSCWRAPCSGGGAC